MTIRDDDGFELVDYDHYTGRSVWSAYDGEKTVYRIDYPVDQLIKENAHERAESPTNWKGDWHRIASVPLNMFYDSGLMTAINQQDGAFASRWLNNGDNRAFRTKEGCV